MTKLILSLEDRFISHIQKSAAHSGCWEWTGSKSYAGYGAFKINHKSCLAHRVSYALFVGQIPEGLCVCHSCDNPACCNPSHLFLGTHQDNMTDMQNKGRHPNNGARGENHGRHKLTKQEIYKIREMIEQRHLQKEIADIFGVNQATISYIKTKKNWEWLK